MIQRPKPRCSSADLWRRSSRLCQSRHNLGSVLPMEVGSEISKKRPIGLRMKVSELLRVLSDMATA
jgi:hypothetical protein